MLYCADNEKRLTKKVKELNGEIVGNAAKVQTALRLSEEDQTTIVTLKKEVEKAWKLVDASHEKVLACTLHCCLTGHSRKLLAGHKYVVLKRVHETLTAVCTNVSLTMSFLFTSLPAWESSLTSLCTLKHG